MDSNASTPGRGGHAPLAGTSDVTQAAQAAIVDLATKARDKAEAVAQAAADAVDRNRGGAARVLENAASAIHDRASRLPGGEGVTRWAAAAADELDATAQYVRDHKPQQMLTDLTQFVRRHPGASIVGAAVAGVLVGRVFRKH